MNYKDIYVQNIYDLEVPIPNTCPHCNGRIAPVVIYSTINKTRDKDVETLAILLECPICEKYYALQFLLKNYRSTIELVSYTYQPKVDINIPNQIDIVSNNFRDIYTQSEIALSQNLIDIAGMGYRKSTEYLIKDYLIYKNVDTPEKIIKLPLKQAILKLDNEEIKSLALACAYLGNDHAHILKRFENNDITDLKTFLDTLILYISMKVTIDQSGKISSNWSNGSILPINLPSSR